MRMMYSQADWEIEARLSLDASRARRNRLPVKLLWRDFLARLAIVGFVLLLGAVMMVAMTFIFAALGAE